MNFVQMHPEYRPEPPKRSLIDRADAYLSEHPVVQALLGGLLVGIMLGICAWLIWTAV